MAQFGASIQTAQVTTGSFLTTIDVAVAGFAGYPNNPGARNQVGAAYYDATGTLSNVYGVPGKYRYVKYSSTSNPSLTGVTGPFIVYWTDATYTTVTPVTSEGLYNGANNVAGLVMPNLTSLSTLTAATLATALNGNYCWMCVGGYVGGIFAPASTAVGDALIGLAGSTFNMSRTAAATAPTNRVVAWATTAVATNLCNALVVLES